MGKENKEENIGCGPVLLAALVAAGLISREVANNKEWTIVPVTANNGKKAVEVITNKEGRIEIEEGTLVLVKGEVKDPKTGEVYFIFGMDENGEYIGGTIDGECLKKEGITIKEKDLTEYDIYQITAESSNIQDGTETGANILGRLENGDYVLAYEPSTKKEDGEFQQAIAITADGNLVQGYIPEEDLERVKALRRNDLKVESQEELSVAQVDTSKDGGVDLNLRPEPGSTEKIIGIPNGSKVEVSGEKVQKGERTWVKVKYKGQNEKIYEGWVVEEYLIYREQEKDSETISTKEISLNEEGTASGIDVSGASGKQLAKMIENGIPNRINTEIYDEDKVNISKRSGDINFVYIKLGASGYGSGKLNIIENYDQYIEQIQVCEEKGLPYGFYYYSTAITKAEAEEEARHIKKVIKELKGKYNLKHNLLDVVVDFESADEEDRHHDEPRNQVSEAKAHLINMLMEDGSGVTIYIAPRAYSSRLAERIIDMKVLREALKEPDKVTIWLCSSVNAKGKDSSKLATYEKELTDMGFRIIARQFITDVTSMDGKCDLNVMDPQYLQQKIKESNLGTLSQNNWSMQRNMSDEITNEATSSGREEWEYEL